MRIPKAFCLLILAVSLLSAKSVKVTLLATTDLHGSVYPYDYYTAQPAARGLAKIAKLVEAARSANPNTVLVDCGDAIQGSPMEAVYQHWVRDGKLPANLPPVEGLAADPVMLAMNRIGYDAMAMGNHEFNFGLKNLNRARGDARFPWLSANTRVLPGASNRPFDAYIVKEFDGVKVAVIGITTPAVPMWDEPPNYKGYTFDPIVETVQRVVTELKSRQHVDLVIVAAHSGLGRDLKTGALEPGDLPGENAIVDIANKVKGVDAIVFGHTHRELPSATVNGVLLMQPKNWAISLGEMDFVLNNDGGAWTVQSKSSHLVPVTASGAVDEAILKLTAPHHQAAERYLNTPVATSKIDLSAATARVEDTAILDAVQRVQLAESKADVSFAASFNPRAHIPAGPVTVRQIAALYLYDNTLLAIEGTGQMVRDALENSARFYLSCTGDCSGGPLVNTKFMGFNYDMAAGVEYEIDLSQPSASVSRT